MKYIGLHNLTRGVQILFFFSSRRRHTRWNCDWSSGRVLFRSGKAELRREPLRSVGMHRDARGEVLARERAVALYAHGDRALEHAERHEEQPEQRARHEAQGRSEERRVGKECRTGWSADHLKKK